MQQKTFKIKRIFTPTGHPQQALLLPGIDASIQLPFAARFAAGIEVENQPEVIGKSAIVEFEKEVMGIPFEPVIVKVIDTE
jgi:hypothetical protein